MKIIFSILIILVSLATRAEGRGDEQKSQGIDREAIRLVIRKNLNAFESCYNEALKRAPGIGGKIELEWDIDVGGVVRNPKVSKSAIEDKLMDDCMVAALKGLKFPSPPDTQIARVKYPFVFSSQ